MQSRIVWPFKTMNSYWVVRASTQTKGQNQWDVLSRRRFETDAASRHSCSIWKRVFRSSAGQCSVTSRQRHTSSALLNQETPDLSHHIWLPNLPDLNPVVNLQYTPCVECASGVSLSYQGIGRRRTETTHQQRCAVGEWRQRLYTVSQKKGDTILLSISLLNIDRIFIILSPTYSVGNLQ